MPNNSHFFAYLSRMKFIHRWGLMRNTQVENIQEHSLQVAMIAHALALIRNRLFAGSLDPERVMVLAVFHEVSEVITGDFPSPLKYFNPEISRAYSHIEQVASRKLWDMIPRELQPDYRSVLFREAGDADAWELVKAADKVSAYTKCLEELKAGNQEFAKAKDSLEREIADLGQPEVDYFMREFVHSFTLALDELN
ncbi:MAG: 5'-deoxynucleotidase [Spirochaetaceae bacterium]|nr:5'-deoxynucleotidase [Spirochaetaceae bacterium]MDE0447324.1 5'-deoxynucleotidase [Spirochaetaceae bacterium]